MSNIHKGHRKRMKDRFIENGLDNFNDHNVLELLLFFAIPMRDVNELAHQLMGAFGSLAAVFDAPYEELVKIKGISENSATLIKLIPQMSRRYLISKGSDDIILNTTKKAGQFLVPHFYALRDEVVYILCLDAKCKMLSCQLLFKGNVNSAYVSIRKIVEVALMSNATSVILAHNHTSGIALPSDEDARTTHRIREALDLVGITLADHIVVADDDFVSMADSGFFID